MEMVVVVVVSRPPQSPPHPTPIPHPTPPRWAGFGVGVGGGPAGWGEGRGGWPDPPTHPAGPPPPLSPLAGVLGGWGGLRDRGLRDRGLMREAEGRLLINRGINRGNPPSQIGSKSHSLKSQAYNSLFVKREIGNPVASLYDQGWAEPSRGAPWVKKHTFWDWQVPSLIFEEITCFCWKTILKKHGKTIRQLGDVCIYT